MHVSKETTRLNLDFTNGATDTTINPKSLELLGRHGNYASAHNMLSTMKVAPTESRASAIGRIYCNLPQQSIGQILFLGRPVEINKYAIGAKNVKLL